MYKIYINENCLGLADENEAQSLGYPGCVRMPYLAGKKVLLNYIDKLEKSPDAGMILLVTPDPKAMFDLYRSLYKEIKAAGGLCINSKEQILFIERLGRWDLPKGKVDKHEKLKDAALREVREETGLECLICKKLGSTWHTYIDQQNRRILKKTAWYHLELILDQRVVVQAEENITDYRWLSASDFLNSKLPTYQSIREIVKKVKIEA